MEGGDKEERQGRRAGVQFQREKRRTRERERILSLHIADDGDIPFHPSS